MSLVLFYNKIWFVTFYLRVTFMNENTLSEPVA